MRNKRIIFIILIILILGVILPKIILKDKVISTSEPQCPSQDVWIFLDDPVERIMLLLGGTQALSKDSQSNFIVRAYTIFGIPFATLEVEGCYGAVKRLY